MFSRLRAYRRYRRMQRQLAALDRLDERDRRGGGRRPSGRPAGAGFRPSRGELRFAGGLVLVVAALVAVRIWFPELALGPHRDGPTIVHGSPPPAGAGPFAFMSTVGSGRPVTYSSCTPIHYVINPAGMPPAIPPLVRQAAQEIGSASGLTFTDDGTSTESPSADRPARQPDRYGPGWAPVLVAWADRPPDHDATGAGSDTFGIGGSTSITEAGRPDSARYVTGDVTLFAQALTPLLNGRNGPARVRAVILHEFGHVVGLAHVSDPKQLMTPVYHDLTDLGPGDRAGLQQLGSGPCLRDRPRLGG